MERVTRSWLGVSVQDISLADKESLKLGVDQGSLVREVVVDSPAYKAGLKMNDVIVEFDWSHKLTIQERFQNR